MDLGSHPKNSVMIPTHRKSELRGGSHANGPESPPDGTRGQWRTANRQGSHRRPRLCRATHTGALKDRSRSAGSDVLEPYDAQVSRTVLRGGEGGNAFPLPDKVPQGVYLSRSSVGQSGMRAHVWQFSPAREQICHGTGDLSSDTLTLGRDCVP